MNIFHSSTPQRFLFIVIAILTRLLLLPPKFSVPSPPGAIVVSGAGSGIGKHVVERLSKDLPNYTIYGIVRKKDQYNKLLALSNNNNNDDNKTKNNIIPLIADLTDRSSLEKAIIKKVKEPIIGLFDAAGIPIPNTPIEFVDVDTMRQLYEVDVFGLVNLIQVTLPLMTRGDGARIVLMGSITGIITSPFMGADPFRAVEAVADALRREVKSSGISISVIQAGFLQSPIIDKTKKEDQIVRQDIAKDEYKRIALEQYYPTLSQHDYENLVPYEQMSPITDVSDAVLDALTNPRPKIKYICGAIPVPFLPIKLAAMAMHILPHHILDYFT